MVDIWISSVQVIGLFTMRYLILVKVLLPLLVVFATRLKHGERNNT